jgi:hypothetical protein
MSKHVTISAIEGAVRFALPIAGAPRVPANPLLNMRAKFRNRK